MGVASIEFSASAVVMWMCPQKPYTLDVISCLKPAINAEASKMTLKLIPTAMIAIRIMTRVNDRDSWSRMRLTMKWLNST